jgi:ParB/RepB/Spo0J family partition protein
MDTVIETTLNNIIFVPLDQTIDNKYQAGEIDQSAVNDIKASLIADRGNGAKGLHQVPEARVTPDGLYELVFGRHRRAAFIQLAQEDPFWNEMPVIVREMTDRQMFETLATENLRRRAINPMEKAELYSRYMNSFGVKSPEAAQFFNTTEEDIRGSVRFSNLHPVAQKLLRDGKLNVTHGRTVLSAQKVLSKEWQEKMLKDIQNDTWESPQVAIRNALYTDSNAVHIDQHFEAWQDVKKFPVKYLPQLAKSQVAQILDVQKEDKARKISMALVMERVESAISFSDSEFPGFTSEQMQKVRTLANPPACQSCDFHMAFNGSHFCGLKACFDRKVAAWEQAEIARHAKELGIALYVNEATDGRALELNRYMDYDQKLFKDRHTDLRLRPTTREIWNNFDGVPRNLQVVVVGKTAANRLKKQVEAVQQEIKKQAVDNREEEKREREQEIRSIKIKHLVKFHWEVASPAFVSAFDGITSMPFLHFLLDHFMETMMDPSLPEETDDEEELEAQALRMKKADGLRQMRRLIMHRLLYQREEIRTINDKKPVLAFAKGCQKIADEWCVKLGATFLKQAEQYQEDLDAAIKATKRQAVTAETE